MPRRLETPSAQGRIDLFVLCNGEDSVRYPRLSLEPPPHPSDRIDRGLDLKARDQHELRRDSSGPKTAAASGARPPLRAGGWRNGCPRRSNRDAETASRWLAFCAPHLWSPRAASRLHRRCGRSPRPDCGRSGTHQPPPPLRPDELRRRGSAPHPRPADRHAPSPPSPSTLSTAERSPSGPKRLTSRSPAARPARATNVAHFPPEIMTGRTLA